MCDAKSSKWVFGLINRDFFKAFKVITIQLDSKKSFIKFMCFGEEYMKDTDYIEGYIEFYEEVDIEYIRTNIPTLAKAALIKFKGNVFEAVMYCARHLAVRIDWLDSDKYLNYVTKNYYENGVEVKYYPHTDSEMGNFIPVNYNYETNEYYEAWRALSNKYGTYDKACETLLKDDDEFDKFRLIVDNQFDLNDNNEFDKWRLRDDKRFDIYKEFYYEKGDKLRVSDSRANYDKTLEYSDPEGTVGLYRKLFERVHGYEIGNRYEPFDKFYYGELQDNYRFGGGGGGEPFYKIYCVDSSDDEFE